MQMLQGLSLMSSWLKPIKEQDCPSPALHPIRAVIVLLSLCNAMGRSTRSSTTTQSGDKGGAKNPSTG